MRYSLALLFFFILTKFTAAQNQSDSTKILTEVTVKAYLSNQTLMSLPASASVIHLKQIEQNSNQSLLPVLNTVSGVKMEERSPGSYRVSIRGSLLRSPFGVRNIKIYLDDYPLTDASGNTYFNLLDPSSVSRMEVLKGPDGSLFGANSGGVILLNTQSNEDKNAINIGSGSYGLFKENIQINQNNKKLQYNFHQGIQTSDGYRANSRLKRYFFQTQENWNYHPKGTLNFSSFYSDLAYQTPGGLTAAQMQSNPQAARPATPFAPGAIEQQAGIYNKTFFGGLRNEYQLSSRWKHIVSISTIQTDLKNPFITNYEKRKEHSLALRSYFEYKNSSSQKLKFQWNTGWEYQKTKSDIINYGNDKGTPTNVLAADGIDNQMQFFFTRFAFQDGTHFKAEVSNSLNFANYSFRKLSESTSNSILGKVNLKAQLMPRLALSYLIHSNFVVRAIVSKGYSSPTAEEIRASDQKINTDLQAEYGWNYELGLRIRTPFENVYLDASAFDYHLKNAIVRRTNANDQDYYLNAGGTQQRGLELALNTRLLNQSVDLIKNIYWNSSFTFYDFKFSNYQVAGNNYSGNRLTGVPKTNINSNLNIDFEKQWNLFVNYQFNGKTTLNDAASVYANSYHLLTLKISKQFPIGKSKLDLNFGVDNLLNQDYSLGNDLNAFGNRYFNPAAKRNYFGGLGFSI
ncbi:MAG: TonB-dependent receptor [Sphingobacteriales bacterium]|nr:TonB-dependent receptor [Sphingobacteriales bacterium]